MAKTPIRYARICRSAARDEALPVTPHRALARSYETGDNQASILLHVYL
ncbi:hypothetical protein CPBF367_04230 [Xanthomonas arboricola pv. juglandis]|nr:hypothetical protein CPBF367_04230 [Xanthomonas arboricola pv. juglandis]